MRNLSTLLIMSALVSLVLGHAGKFPDVYRNESCVKPAPAKIYSYHIHLLYWQTNKG